MKKVKLSLLGNRQCTFHQAIDELCALLLSLPKKVAQNENFLHYALPFISSLQLQVFVDTSNLVCGLNQGPQSHEV